MLLAISAGLGAAIGELTSYLVGYYSYFILSDERKRKMKFMLKIFERYGLFVIFLFALTPLPDDLLFIPMGIMRYNFVKAFIPGLSGKFLISLILAFGGRLSIDSIKNFYTNSGVLGLILPFSIIIVLTVFIFKLDWEKFFEKYFKSTKI